MTKTIRQSTHGKKCLRTQAYQGSKRTAMRSNPEDPVFKTNLQNRKPSICKYTVKPSTVADRFYTEDIEDDESEDWPSGFYDANGNYYGDCGENESVDNCKTTTHGYDLHRMSWSVYVCRSQE
jgi:hypothetical protein